MKTYRIIFAIVAFIAASGVIFYTRSTQEDIANYLFRILRELREQQPDTTQEEVYKAIKFNIEERGFSPNAVDSESGLSLLIYAAGAGSLQIVKYLVSKGANIEYKSPLNETALMYGAMSGNLPLVQFLVEKGADVNAVSYGWSVLKWSKDFNQEPTKAVTDYLISKGAKPVLYEWGYDGPLPPI